MCLLYCLDRLPETSSHHNGTMTTYSSSPLARARRGLGILGTVMLPGETCQDIQYQCLSYLQDHGMTPLNSAMISGNVFTKRSAATKWIVSLNCHSPFKIQLDNNSKLRSVGLPTSFVIITSRQSAKSFPLRLIQASGRTSWPSLSLQTSSM